MNSALFLAFAVAFGGLAYVFAKNLLRARNSAEIYNRWQLIRRAESPILFWLTVGVYSIATAVVVGAAGACVVAAVAIAWN